LDFGFWISDLGVNHGGHQEGTENTEIFGADDADNADFRGFFSGFRSWDLGFGIISYKVAC